MKRHTMRVFSACQPSGSLHIGNLLGAINQFVATQDIAECFFCVADMHATTVKHDPAKLRQSTKGVIATYIAAGIDPNKSTIFAQSQVPEHAELAWILNCVARIGWLERMVQFKDKVGENKERSSVGLFTYPVLMAADILAYKATHVPVGSDQLQHLNLVVDIAQKFNREYGETFPYPEPIHSTSPRIMSLQDASNKMSKSDPNPAGCLMLTDSNDTIAKKCRRATADILPFPTCDEEILKPEIENLVRIYMALANVSRETVFAEFGGKGYGIFKPALAEVAISVIHPIRDRVEHLMQEDLVSIIKDGGEQARAIAVPIVREAKEKFGYLI